MFYKTKTGKTIMIFNKRPRNLSAGGLIKGHPKINKIPDDTISSYLEYGSLVVPVPVMKSGIMNDYKGKIVGEKTTDRSKLSPTIVMPNELVVNRKYAKNVEDFLRKRGIILPLPLPK